MQMAILWLMSCFDHLFVYVTGWRLLLGAPQLAAAGAATTNGVKQFSTLSRLENSGFYMYRQFNIKRFHVLPTYLYLCVLCGSENKQRLFPYTTLTDWFLWLRRSVFIARYGLDLYIWYIYLAAIGLTPGGSSTAHIYTQTVHRIQRTEHI